ncbi:hypothetical protein NX059_002638 [Plenodomus lindquistii]|nr:hypothetical protein NX059_002638 [Plenodomus lindquistii]
MAPQGGANGVAPVALLQKNPPAQPPRGPKAAPPRLKLICRRLPPGLTRPEFESVLGPEWKLGAGRIDWLNYRKGKISTDAAKPSRPSRAYLHVTKQEHVKALGDLIRASTFHDSTKSWQDPALVGPPTLEFAPYPKMPGGRRRNDNRQGTIDQDQEFKDFLESLTNPITKAPAPENDGLKEKVKTTPLIEALREKKANREKPNSKTNRQTRADAKEDAADKKILAKSGKENAPNAGDKNRRLNKGDKAEAAAKEAVKIANRQASSSRSATPSTANDKTSASPATERKRGNVANVKSMLQRDLGVGPAPNRRRGTKREVGPAAPDTASQAKDVTATEEKAKESQTPQPASTSAADKNAVAQKKERPTRAERRAFKAGTTDKSTEKTTPGDAKAQTPTKAPAPQILKKPQAPIAPKGPAASRAPPTEPAAARNSPAHSQAQLNNLPMSEAPPAPQTAALPRPAPPSPSPAPAATSKQAFLKHANPSQGITEPLIEEAMKAFGGIDRVEIDKRKGFAYVDFAEPAGLQKAMAASPIKIAQGAVQVLERKEKIARAPRYAPPPTGPTRGGHAGRGPFAPRGRGGRGGIRGGGHVGPASGVPAGDTAPSASATPVVPAPKATPAAT